MEVKKTATPGNKRMWLRLGDADKIQRYFAVIDDKMCGAHATRRLVLPT